MNEREIFEAALDITDAASLDEFLANSCGSDNVLREGVESLLAAHAARDEFLRTPLVQEPSRRLFTDVGPEITQGFAEDESVSDNAGTTDLSFLQPSTRADSMGVLGHYEILGVVGKGGCGVVLKAFDEKLHRHVAIKVINTTYSVSQTTRMRLLREARAAAGIRHENLVPVYSVEEQPIPYLVMELIDGETLEQKLHADGPLNVDDLLRIGEQIALGLAAAHKNGLIHRDIKPANILLESGPEQCAKITDFGLARAVEDVSLTQSGIIQGTPLYMSPEQAQGEPLDHRSDLFSLGSVLYEIATGRSPFLASSTLAVLNRVVRDEPCPIQEAAPNVPVWLIRIIDKLLAKNLNERYQSADEVADLFIKCQAELHATGRVTCVPEFTADTPPIPAGVPLTDSGTHPTRERAGALNAVTSKRAIVAISSMFLAVLLLLTLKPMFDRSEHSSDSTIEMPAPADAVAAAPSALDSLSERALWNGWSKDAPPPAVAPFDAKQAFEHQEKWAQFLNVPVEYTNSIGMTFCLIPPGEFLMGSSEDDIRELLIPRANLLDWLESEQPQHVVVISQPFYLGMYEVTQREYMAIMTINPSYFSSSGEGKAYVEGFDTASYPVEQVSWNDAAEFCIRLNEIEKRTPSYRLLNRAILQKNGTGYRLPAEAEWEFACRAGTTTKLWFNKYGDESSKVVWAGGWTGQRTHEVGELKANPFGLFDVHGNVQEWVQDVWERDYYAELSETLSVDPQGPKANLDQRVARGGRWDGGLDECRSASRNHFHQSLRLHDIGFRVVLPIPFNDK